MKNELSDLTSKELRTLLGEETRIFLQALDLNKSIEELEAIRKKFRLIVNALKEKERNNK